MKATINGITIEAETAQELAIVIIAMQNNAAQAAQAVPTGTKPAKKTIKHGDAVTKRLESIAAMADETILSICRDAFADEKVKWSVVRLTYHAKIKRPHLLPFEDIAPAVLAGFRSSIQRAMDGETSGSYAEAIVKWYNRSSVASYVKA
jgi:hypothetical protein